MRGIVGTALGAVLLLTVAACSDDSRTSGTAPRADSSPSLYTLSPLPVPTPGPPSGRLHASIRQSSRDTLLDRFQVWIDNDTAAGIRPVRVRYADALLRADLPATGLRAIPSRSERGFSIHQPARPACPEDRTAASARLTVTYRSRGRLHTVSLRPEDETGVVARYAAARCLYLAVRQVATLRFADAVTQDPPGGPGAEAHLTLVAHTSGRGGHTLSIDTVAGTPVLSPASGDAWRPDVGVLGTDPTIRIDLPMRPTRCDAHAFAESGGATTFLIGIHLDGVAGQLRILMSPLGARHAIDAALAACGPLTTVDGGTAGPG